MNKRLMKNVVLVAALMFSGSIGIFGQSKQTRSLELLDTVQVGSTQLKAGIYKLVWEGSNSTVQVNFVRNGKIVATAEGKIVERTAPASRDRIVTIDVNKTRELQEIDFAGKKDALVFSSSPQGLK
jgi:hypothetical protein